MTETRDQAFERRIMEGYERQQETMQRAERAEALLRRIWEEGLYEDQTSALIEAFFQSAPSTHTEESG